MIVIIVIIISGCIYERRTIQRCFNYLIGKKNELAQIKDVDKNDGDSTDKAHDDLDIYKINSPDRQIEIEIQPNINKVLMALSPISEVVTNFEINKKGNTHEKI